jgi:hypothetical protein
MEGVLEGWRLACWRAARRADLVCPVGAAAGLGVAGSWTGSGQDVEEQQQRREDDAAHLCERRARRAADWVQGTIERAPRRYARPARGHPRVDREGHGGDQLDLATVPISTRSVTVCHQPAGAER